MKTKGLIAAIAVSAGLVLGSAALAQEETPVDMKDLPSPAQTTIKKKPEAIKFFGAQGRLVKARNAMTR